MIKNFTLFLSMLVALSSIGQYRYFYASILGANEVPAVTSDGSGISIARFNTISKNIELWGNYRNLTSEVSVSHIHQGAAGVNGGVVVDLTNTDGTSGTLVGNDILTAAEETALLAGNMYVNVHSENFGAGELRGQLMPLGDGQGVFLNARLQGAQEFPVNNSLGTGGANVLFDLASKKVYVTGSYSGLTTNVTVSHIHIGNVGSNGGVIVNLFNSGGTSGTIHGEDVLTEAEEIALLAAGTYVNVHSSTFPDGELRGQVNQFTDQLYFGGRLLAANEVVTPPTPPVVSDARGTVIAGYNRQTRQLVLGGDYQALSGDITGAHIHTGAAGTNGVIIINLTQTITGVRYGTYNTVVTLTEEQQTQLLAGNLYVNVHSTAYPGGEIRSQLIPTTPGESQFAVMTPSGAQEVPAVTTPATGMATMLVDKITGQAYVTATYAGLLGDITMAHIHRGRIGTNGPVIMPLTFASTREGTVSGAQILSPAFVDSFINGFTYLNIHSGVHPGGEIRAQAGNLVLPVELGYFTGFRQKNEVVLQWEATTEENVLQYEIEQQNVQTRSWLYKATVPAKGNAPVTYQAQDLPFAATDGYVYYRLKTVDKDGTFSYSQVLKIDYAAENKDGLIIAGNPVKGTLRFMLNGTEDVSVSNVTVIDQLGRNLIQSRVSSVGMQSLNTTNLPAGIYWLKVQAGKQVEVKRFVKE